MTPSFFLPTHVAKKVDHRLSTEIQRTRVDKVVTGAGDVCHAIDRLEQVLRGQVLIGCLA